VANDIEADDHLRCHARALVDILERHNLHAASGRETLPERPAVDRDVTGPRLPNSAPPCSSTVS